MKKDLILGVAANYRWPILKNFVCSLRQTDYKGDVILFVDADIDQNTRDRLDQCGIQSIGIYPTSPYLKGLPDSSTLEQLPPSVYRILIFYNFLKENVDKYDQVFLTDVRDVVFQKDPFAFESQNKLCFFMESPVPLKYSDWNALWMIATFGVRTLHELGDNQVSNVGTVIGPVPRMIPYLASMIRHLMIVQVHMMFGIEQAAHNYVIVKKEVEDYLLFYTEDGPVATLAGYTEVAQDEKGQVVNLKNDIANVVHQYDRHPSLKSSFDLKYN
jgi:hypothetical protein